MADHRATAPRGSAGPPGFASATRPPSPWHARPTEGRESARPVSPTERRLSSVRWRTKSLEHRTRPTASDQCSVRVLLYDTWNPSSQRANLTIVLRGLVVCSFGCWSLTARQPARSRRNSIARAACVAYALSTDFITSHAKQARAADGAARRAHPARRERSRLSESRACASSPWPACFSGPSSLAASSDP